MSETSGKSIIEPTIDAINPPEYNGNFSLGLSVPNPHSRNTFIIRYVNSTRPYDFILKFCNLSNVRSEKCERNKFSSWTNRKKKLLYFSFFHRKKKTTLGKQKAGRAFSICGCVYFHIFIFPLTYCRLQLSRAEIWKEVFCGEFASVATLSVSVVVAIIFRRYHIGSNLVMALVEVLLFDSSCQEFPTLLLFRELLLTEQSSKLGKVLEFFSYIVAGSYRNRNEGCIFCDNRKV